MKDNGKVTAVAKRGEVTLAQQVADIAQKLEGVLQSDRYSGEALLQMVNLLYHTPDDVLPELTEIPRGLVLPLSIMMTKAQLLNRPVDGNGCLIPAAQLWWTNFMKLMRSVGRRHFSVGAELAEGQMTKEAEKPGEEYELP